STYWHRWLVPGGPCSLLYWHFSCTSQTLPSSPLLPHYLSDSHQSFVPTRSLNVHIHTSFMRSIKMLLHLSPGLQMASILSQPVQIKHASGKQVQVILSSLIVLPRYLTMPPGSPAVYTLFRPVRT